MRSEKTRGEERTGCESRGPRSRCAHPQLLEIMRAKVYSSPPSEALTGLVSLAPSAPLRAASAAPIHSIRVFPSNGQGSAFDVKGPECGESLSSGRKEAVYRAPEMTIGGGGVLRAPSAAPAAHSASAHPAAGALPAPGGPFSRPRGDLVAPSTSYASKWVPGLARDRGSERPRAACAGRSSLAVRARGERGRGPFRGCHTARVW